jgi:hypothetical protein
MGYYGDIVKKEVTIASLEEKPFKITGITSDIEGNIEYELKTVQEGKEYRLEIKTRSGIKEPFQGRVVLKTSHQKKPQLELLVIGKLEKEVKVAPVYLYFGIIDTGKGVIDPKSLERTVVVSKFREGDLTIHKIETSKDWITAETETNEKGEKYTVVIRLKDKLPKGKFRENITIHTEHLKRTDVSNIIIEGKVK